MRRREFIGLVAALATVAPRVARAQQAAIPTIGFLDSGFAKGMDAYLDGFRRGLKETGYAEGENVAIVFRWSEGIS